jgi:hypothetical protein
MGDTDACIENLPKKFTTTISVPFSLKKLCDCEKKQQFHQIIFAFSILFTNNISYMFFLQTYILIATSALSLKKSDEVYDKGRRHF